MAEKSNNSSIWAGIIVAAGSGSRANLEKPKQYEKCYFSNAYESVLSRSIRSILPFVDILQVVIADGHEEFYNESIAEFASDKKLLPAVIGGNNRQASVYNGLQALQKTLPPLPTLPPAPKFVMIHDAARPFVGAHQLQSLKMATEESGSAVPCLNMKDSVCQTDKGSIAGYLDRSSLVQVQTPQGFDFETILQAHARQAGKDYTDDASLAKDFGVKVTAIEGSPDNHKLTTRDDFATLNTENIWTTGMDVHAIGAGKGVILGGIEIACDFSLKGHSDADVVLHALCDAMLAAASEADIGHHFPPSDDKWKDANSASFIEFAYKKLIRKNIQVRFVDVVIICEQPKIAPHRIAICDNLARLLQVEPSQIAVKSTTTEKLGALGKGDGIAAWVTLTCRTAKGHHHG